jgi:Winged helix-turn helix
VAKQSPRIELDERARAELGHRAASLTLPYRTVVRAKIILLAAEGLQNAEIAERVDLSADRVGQWRRRFRAEGLGGLEDRPRSGRPSRFPPGGGHRGQGGRLRATGRRRPALAPLHG